MLKLNILMLQFILVNTQYENILNNILFQDYNHYYATVTYLGIISEIYPEKIQVILAGETSTGTQIVASKISFNPYGENQRPIILVDAGMHGREWITSPVALFLIYQLVQNHSNIDMISDVDWIIIPNLNPDGYDYSLLYDKTWRKTFSKIDNEDCIGVDINRNFNFHWSPSPKNACSENYPGPHPFSEPEARALRDIAIKYRNYIELYITLHAYGSLITYPWSFTMDPIDNIAEHQMLATLVADAIKKYRGTSYKVGSIINKIYEVNGSSCDWMAGVLGIPLNFGIELPETEWEFNPESSEILPTAIETFEGFKEFHKYILRKSKLNRSNESHH